MKRALALLLMVLAGTATAEAEWQPVVDGVEYQHVTRSGTDAHAVRVDLTNANLRIVTTRESERGLTVSEFAQRNAAIVAINADYFDVDMRPLGLAMGACGIWADAMAEVRNEEVVGVGEGKVRIFARKQPLTTPEPWMTGAVSGWPMVVEDCEPVAKLPGSDHFTRAPHPRTAVGLSGDGKQLYLVVVDGRRDGVPGMTLPDLAQFMDDLGACTAVNLDGGDSSAMWIRDHIVNLPSDLVERRVVNHVAVVAASDYQGCDTPASLPER